MTSTDAETQRRSAFLRRGAAEAGAGEELTPARPLSVCLPLGALPSAVPCARAYVRAVLAEWHCADAADEAELITSELVTNSIQASTDADGRPRYDRGALPVVQLRLSMWADRARVVIEVWDTIPHTPMIKRVGPDDEGGRGLLLVDALATRWNWETVPGWPGKVVKAEIRTDRQE
jgi:anti-sigma regulatory factor (Ser/Thr protein kinase)